MSTGVVRAPRNLAGNLAGAPPCCIMVKVAFGQTDNNSIVPASTCGLDWECMLNAMATKGDVDMAEATAQVQAADDYADLLQTNHTDAFVFSESEQLVLDLFGQLQELELQQSLLRAQQSGTLYLSCRTHTCVVLTRDVADAHDVSALSGDALQEQLIIAQREAMEAKAEYEIRNMITHNVLVMDPVLKAVHGGEHTASAEKYDSCWFLTSPFSSRVGAYSP